MLQINVENDNGAIVVNMFQVDFTSSSPFTFIAGKALTAAQVAGNDQIKLDLAHNTVGSTAITGSFELLDNGVQNDQTTFSGPGQQGTIFTNGVNWTRPELLAFANPTVLLSGVAQQGQTLTASASSNDSDATLHYQWQNSADAGQTWTAIAGAADSANYLVQASDEGYIIRVAASTTDPDNNLTASATCQRRLRSAALITPRSSISRRSSPKFHYPAHCRPARMPRH